VDYLATLEGGDTAIVFGIVNDDVQSSARSTDSRVNVGRILGDAFGDVGSASGHQETAGGEVPLGIFAGYEDDDPSLVDIVDRVVTARPFVVSNIDESET
jgi:nanoRNase/pAp phosphatase (c-di-AMP/oligoRNAs hydrolase)